MGSSHEDSNHLANAHLISAAPDLLNSVKCLMVEIEFIKRTNGQYLGMDLNVAMEQVESAVKKALGII